MRAYRRQDQDPEHGGEISPLLLLGAECLDRRNDRFEVAEFTRQSCIFRAGDALGEASANFFVTAKDDIEIIVGGHFWEPERKAAEPQDSYRRTLKRSASACKGARSEASSQPTSSIASTSRAMS